MITNLFGARRYLRLAPFDTSTEQGRSAERYRRAALSVLANIASKALAMLAMVVGIGLTMPYLGAERFGVWATIASFGGMLMFLDLGVGNALTNQVSKAYAGPAPDTEVARVISGGIGSLAIIGLTASVVLYFLASCLPWQSIIKVNDPEGLSEVRLTAQVFGALFGMILITNGIQRVFVGLQRSFEAHLISALASLLSIAGIWTAARCHAEIPALLAITLGSQAVGGALMVAIVMRRMGVSFGAIIASIKHVAPELIRTGALFFVLQIGTMVGWGADSLIISSTLGATAVAAYSVSQRLFQFVSMPLAVINAPLWAAYADAHVHGDGYFIQKTLTKSIGYTIAVAMAGSIILIFGAKILIRHWTDGQVEVSPYLLGAFAVWTVIESVGNAFAMFMNGCGIVKPQIAAVLLFCITAIPIKLVMASAIGLHGVLIATIACYLLSVPILYFVAFRREISKAAMLGQASS